MRFFISAPICISRWLLLLVKHRIVVDHVERDGRETEAPEDLLCLDAADESLEKFAGRAVAEHDLFLLVVLPVEDKESLMHAIKELDVFFVRELELRVQLGDVDDDHPQQRCRKKEHGDYHHAHADELNCHRLHVDDGRWNEQEVGQRDL